MASSPETSDLSWEVLNRHRLLANAGEQARFERDLAAFVEEYRHWFADEEPTGILPNVRSTDLIHCEVVNGQPERCMPENYRVNYDPGTNSYRCLEAGAPNCRAPGEDWLTQPQRDVRLSFGAEGRRCRWTIDGVVEEQSCRWTISTPVNQRREVSVLRLDDGAIAQTIVEPHDILILALGDSFSAGEGNPHVQWRTGRHPAAWLDARCHRSLMSGPALTAAVLARSNPHASVTLLHYGCSGGSIADGLVAPWAQLETAADIRAQYDRFGIRGTEFDRRRVATTGAQLHDVPLSQLDQARADLTINGQLIQPDVILISVGGNDIGFAGIVSALAAHGSTPVDLRADLGPDGVERVDDWRPYAPFDQASWVQSARDVPCRGLSHLDCLTQRVRDRIGTPQDQGSIHTTLVSQYDQLAAGLAPLASSPDRVFITQYPNFVMREPDGVDAGEAKPEQAVGCHDRPFDGRPGFIPSIFAWLPGVGVEREASSQAEARFLNPLNGAVEAAAGRHGWSTVSTHLDNGRTHGYCSHNRYYNTIFDSYYDQGRRYDQGRPLGNATILRPDNIFNLPVGTRVIWDGTRRCFTAFPDRATCLPRPPTRPVMELRRNVDEGDSFEDMLADTSTLGTTGPVHPNLFGHCNYASAIVTSLVRELPGLPYGTSLVEDVRSAPESGLKAAYVCDPQRWGWRHNESARSDAS